MTEVAIRDRIRSGKDGAIRRVLLAEDQTVNQRVVTAMLEHLGCVVDVVSDGAQAVDAAYRTDYHAILMDCQIPVLDGYRATGEIRCLQGDARHTPIIAVTASTMKGDQERCLEAGMDDYLTKPISLKALATVLDLWAPDHSTPVMEIPNLDAKVVARLERLGKAVGEDLMGELAVLFLADAEALILAVRSGLAAADAASVSEAAHALRGSSANLGATHLSHLCATLEEEAEQDDLVNGATFLDAIEGEFTRVRSILDARIPAP